ncbi:AAA family ATPase [Extensimonas sp. H3M7-6]|uniref:bifunctional aminoglycoside phosphotransferase/ATP-binding protein n=1 Tax=Extensimonas soli TaxID=3031322 RepID=UPI0023DC15F1|nr:bifunctional aminoglycoside phosphotransferase/ATP-binding protein [Extensimonas sp. H3M7-6]MDF1482397.1 AAA family ATPase [Extensimonas sp. H3M7-6]
MLSDPLDAFQQAQALLERLQRQPQAFGQAASVERLQTHISWLLLVGEHVYKFKKPLKLEFLDFSTAALRRAACEEELRINRRTAPQLYLDVVAVVEGDAQSEVQGLGACRTLGVESENAPRRGQFLPDSPPHSGTMGQEDGKKWAAAAHSQPTIPKSDRLLGGLRVLPAAEADVLGLQALAHAVHMRRFAQDELLAAMLAQGRLLPAHIDALARHVAQFHAAAAVAAPDAGWGSAAAVRAPVTECVQAVQSVTAAALPALAPTVQALAQWCAAQGEALAPVFAARLQQGWVRECHGDLHLGNLVLLEGVPVLFDAIEFNPALRWIDVMADVAFLVMDLHAHGRADLGGRFLNAWLERTGDYAGLALLRYYCVYRALVRARVAGVRLAQLHAEAGARAGEAQSLAQVQAGAEIQAEAQAAALETASEVQRYVQLAARLSAPGPSGLALAHGFSGAGKTTQSQALLARGVVRVRADVERKRLFGLAPEDASAAVPGGIYTPEATERTYARLAELARAVLQAGYPVLVDATLLAGAQRARFIALAAQLRVPWCILAFEAPPEVLRARITQRQQAGGDASEATLAVLERQLASAQPLSAQEEAHTLHLDTTQPIDWDAVLAQLLEAGPGAATSETAAAAGTAAPRS